MNIRLAIRALGASYLLILPSCAFFRAESSAPQNKSEADKGSYLAAGPTTQLDVSPGQTSLLEALKEEKERVAKLKRELNEISTAHRNTQMRLANLESERDGEHAARVSSEAELESTVAKLRDRDARLLDASLEKAKLEMQVLELQIKASEAKLAKTKASEAGASFK